MTRKVTIVRETPDPAVFFLELDEFSNRVTDWAQYATGPLSEFLAVVAIESKEPYVIRVEVAVKGSETRITETHIKKGDVLNHRYTRVVVDLPKFDYQPLDEPYKAVVHLPVHVIGKSGDFRSLMVCIRPEHNGLSNADYFVVPEWAITTTRFLDAWTELYREGVTE